MDAPLDFLRSLRIKNAIENFMSRTLFRISLPAFSIGLLFLVTGCGEDPRFSARTQYLGGVYGNAEGGPPRDTVSYWDETTQAEAPRSKSVSVNSAPIFTKVAYWSVFHSFQPGAKDSTPHWVITKSFKKTKTTSPVYSVTTSIQRAPWWCPMSILTRIRNLQALISEARRCRISCASYQARVCTQVICQAIQHRTAVSACPNSWPKISSNQSQSEHRSRSRIKDLLGRQYLGLQKIPGIGILIIPLPGI